MNIKQELLSEHSKKNARAIATFVLQQPESIVQLLDYLLGEDRRLAQRAAWPTGLIGEQHPKLLSPYLPQLLQCLQHPQHKAVSRQVYRSLQYMDIPAAYCSPIFDRCLADLKKPKEPVAVKVYAMTVAFHIGRRHPELLPDLKVVIEDNLPRADKGFCSRARQLLPAMVEEIEKLEKP